MAVGVGADESGSFLVLSFSGRVTVEQVLAASARSLELLMRNGAYHALLIFDESVDLSEFDAAAINTIREQRKKEIAGRGLRRMGGAAVVDGSLHADMVMRLWNALSLGHPASTMPFKIFREIDPALEWLTVPGDLARPLIAQVERPSPT